MQKKILKLSCNFVFVILLFICNDCLAILSNHGLDGYQQNVINASKNARIHSNMGNIYFDEGKFVSAMNEYEIAYNISPKTQASGVYLYNIARCYFTIGNVSSAKKAILGAIKKDCINLTYYEFLANCIVKEGNIAQELDYYISRANNPYNRIVVGLIFLKSGYKNEARVVFDEFISKYPDMIITNDLKVLLKKF